MNLVLRKLRCPPFSHMGDLFSITFMKTIKELSSTESQMLSWIKVEVLAKFKVEPSNQC